MKKLFLFLLTTPLIFGDIPPVPEGATGLYCHYNKILHVTDGVQVHRGWLGAVFKLKKKHGEFFAILMTEEGKPHKTAIYKLSDLCKSEVFKDAMSKTTTVASLFEGKVPEAATALGATWCYTWDDPKFAFHEFPVFPTIASVPAASAE